MWQHLRSAGRFSFKNFARQYATKPQSKREALRAMMAKYGKVGVGVYTALCFIDLPLSYWFVHSMGPDVLQEYEQRGRRTLGMKSEIEDTFVNKKVKAGKSMFWTEFAIAYIMHRAFIIVRTPLTIFLTPRVAKRLQRWGLVKQLKPDVKKFVPLEGVHPNFNLRKGGVNPKIGQDQIRK